MNDEPLRPPPDPDDEDGMGLDIIFTDGPEGALIVDTHMLREVKPAQRPSRN